MKIEDALEDVTCNDCSGVIVKNLETKKIYCSKCKKSYDEEYAELN